MNALIINSDKIETIFKTMEYTLKGKENPTNNDEEKISHEELLTILEKLREDDGWQSPSNNDHGVLMFKLASEIQKQVDVFIHLEELRNNSPKFIREKSLPFLVSTLRFHANLSQLSQVSREGIVVCKLSDNSSLSSIGYVLGPALAAGYKVLFISPKELLLALKLIKSTALQIGFPEGSITILPDYIDPTIIYSKYADIIAIFDGENLEELKKKTLYLTPYSTPIIVFDNADLDSACHFITDISWNNDFLFHFSAKEVFVQETVYEQVLGKLKERIQNDSFKHSAKITDKLRTVITQAVDDGIEVFPTHTDSCLGKVLFIGGRLDSDISGCGCISIVPFRNVDEAIALANNNKQGLSASVWTENVGLANRVSQKLDVSNVWINSISIYSPEVGFMPRKLSGKACFGGLQGFNEFCFARDSSSLISRSNKWNFSEKLFLDAINSAKKCLPTWSSTSRINRIYAFNKVISFIENNISELKSNDIPEEWLKNWKVSFLRYIEVPYGFSIPSPVEGFNLNVSHSPRGILIAETGESTSFQNKKLIIASILEGNCLIIADLCKSTTDFYKKISNILPAGVLSVLPYSPKLKYCALRHTEVNAYFNVYHDDEKLDCFHKLTTVSEESFSDVHSKVTYVKNIWSNVG